MSTRPLANRSGLRTAQETPDSRNCLPPATFAFTAETEWPMASQDEARPAPARASKARSSGRYRRVREATLALTETLSAEYQVAQSMPDASPVKWHLAHTTWFFETFML